MVIDSLHPVLIPFFVHRSNGAKEHKNGRPVGNLLSYHNFLAPAATEGCRMSSGGNSLALTAPASWSTANGHGSSSPDYEDRWNRHTRVPMPLPYQPGDGGGVYSPWRLFEERVRTGPFGLRCFPSQPYSPIRILILDGDNVEAVNPRLRQFIQNTPPRIRGERQLGLSPSEPEGPGLTEEEFSRAMKKLRKQVYSPTHPRKKSWRRSLFSNRSSSNSAADEEEKNEATKECAICLETFVSNEQVLVTPCNHMFHNNCLVPWVKSHGQCPVCRSMLCERRRGTSSSHYNNNSRNRNNSNANGSRMTVDDEMAMEVFFLIRAMEEAFNWVNLPR